mmetsp:Transcript_3993/g.14511  ORF Transcript_3993/g.14511 Transcript_3993/m.14511 type:complete len:234 (+) Transcript_3993:163-864(+)
MARAQRNHSHRPARAHRASGSIDGRADDARDAVRFVAHVHARREWGDVEFQRRGRAARVGGGERGGDKGCGGGDVDARARRALRRRRRARARVGRGATRRWRCGRRCEGSSAAAVIGGVELHGDVDELRLDVYHAVRRLGLRRAVARRTSADVGTHILAHRPSHAHRTRPDSVIRRAYAVRIRARRQRRRALGVKSARHAQMLVRAPPLLAPRRRRARAPARDSILLRRHPTR